MEPKGEQLALALASDVRTQEDLDTAMHKIRIFGESYATGAGISPEHRKKWLDDLAEQFFRKVLQKSKCDALADAALDEARGQIDVVERLLAAGKTEEARAALSRAEVLNNIAQSKERKA